MYIHVTSGDPDEPATTTLSLQTISYYDTGFSTTNETGRFIVLAKTEDGRELENLSLVASAVTKSYTFNVCPPVYLGDGTYMTDVSKIGGYSGADNYWGRYVVSLTYSSPEIDNGSVVLESSHAPKIDHSSLIRMVGDGNVGNFFVPASGITFTKKIVGAAYDAADINGDEVIYYSEQWEILRYAYNLTNKVVYPENVSETEMFSDSIVLDYSYSDFNITVKPNNTDKPRIGYVKVNPEANGKITQIITQDGTTKKFGFYYNVPYNGTMGYTILSNGDNKNSYIFLLDLSQHGKEYILQFNIGPNTGRRILFHEGISNYIKVEDDEGNEIEKTTENGSFNLKFDVYKTHNASGYNPNTMFKIIIL